ncbi:MAG: dTDP-4-dehydrorhamnose reductase [Oscillospiraceae bacterium]|nr:dTDP-4-dehydrorhamnose reductase [Oscillospiraceae bacterium]
MRILITGAQGQLGRAVVLEALRRGHEAIGVDVNDFDLTDSDAAGACLAAARPAFVIHCAAYTAVDQAESEPERAFAVNADGTRHVAEYCGAAGIGMIYISTDYVFDGSGAAPHETDEPPAPLSVYGKTKLEGERAALLACPNGIIVRTSWVFGPGGKHFVGTMLRLGREREAVRVVDDQVGSPTYAPDLARLLIDMAERPVPGIYHAANTGYCSWAEFAAEIMARAGLPCRVEPISSADYPQAARRPLNSRLSPLRLMAAGYDRLPTWQDALGRYLYGTK